MKPEGTLIAERLAAQHCAELMRGVRPAADPGKALERLGTRLPDILARVLAPLCAGAKIVVQPGAVSEMNIDALRDRGGGPGQNCLLAVGEQGAPLAVSLPGAALLGLVDLAYGGQGNAGEVPSGTLPHSAQLMFARLETNLIATLAEGLGFAESSMVRPLGRGDDAELLAPFDGCTLSVLPLEITMADADPWELWLAFPSASLSALMVRLHGADAKGPANAEKGGAARPDAAPFADIPVPLRAVLVNMTIPLSRIAGLEPGMVLPVTAARAVPLYAGRRLIAHGTVGTVDDHAALQLTKISKPEG